MQVSPLTDSSHTVRILVFLLVVNTHLFSSAFSQTVFWRSTTDSSRWVDRGTLPLVPWKDTISILEIFPDSQDQAIEGWGGCFNERGWVAMKVLSAESRDSIMRALFDTSGCNFDLCRTPIGASDYAITRYTLNDSVGDYDMSAFSIERDKIDLIPFIKAAMSINSSLKVWGIPWFAPSWMVAGIKSNDSTTMQAYAIYFEKYVRAYRSLGINVCAVGIANEPDQTFNWVDGENMRHFIKNFWGPLFTKNNVPAQMWYATWWRNEFDKWARPVLEDPEASRYISACGVQWPAINWLPLFRKLAPEKKIIMAETICSNPPPNWNMGMRQFNNLVKFLSAGTNAYMQWNMVLDTIGANFTGWMQVAMIHVNQKSKVVNYTPHYYAAKHFSYHIKTGARRLKTVNTTGLGGAAIAFRNPSGEIVLVVGDSTANSHKLVVKVDDKMFSVVIPANSFNTFRINTPNKVIDNSSRIVSHLNNSVFKVAGNQFTVPSFFHGKAYNIFIYDCQGRMLYSAKHATEPVIQLDKQCGAKSGLYIVQVYPSH